VEKEKQGREVGREGGRKTGCGKKPRGRNNEARRKLNTPLNHVAERGGCIELPSMRLTTDGGSLSLKTLFVVNPLKLHLNAFARLQS